MSCKGRTYKLHLVWHSGRREFVQASTGLTKTEIVKAARAYGYECRLIYPDGKRGDWCWLECVAPYQKGKR